MMPRNGGAITSNQDYMNLLYSDSDSDPPDLKLPPLKGKKTRKKKNSYKSFSSDTSVCSVWTFLKVFIFIVILSTMVVLGIISYWLMQQVDVLKDQLASVETHNKGDPEEFQKIHTQLQAINKTVQEFKTGKNGLDNLSKNLTSVREQITKINAFTESLKKSINAAPELKNLPKKVQTLSASIATIGSDLQGARGDITTLKKFKEDASKQLEDVKKKVTAMQGSGKSTPVPTHVQESNRESNTAGDITSLLGVHRKYDENLNALSQGMDQLNKTITAHANEMKDSFGRYEIRLDLLENFTSSIPPDLISKLSSGRTADISDKTVDLLNKILQGEFPSVQNSSLSASGVSEQNFTEFKNEAVADIQNLNVTLVKLVDDVDQLYANMNKNTDSLLNMTGVVQGILHYIGTLKTEKGGTNSIATSTMASFSKPPVHTVQSKTLTSTAHPEISTVKKESSSSESTEAAIKINGIKTMEDLELFFHRWDRKGEGQVDPDVLPDFLGPTAPSKESLKPFDEDNNGKYSIEEFAKALGIHTQKNKKKRLADLLH